MRYLRNTLISLSIIFFSILILQTFLALEILSFGQLSMPFSCLDCMHVQSFTQADWMYTDTSKICLHDCFSQEIVCANILIKFRFLMQSLGKSGAG